MNIQYTTIKPGSILLTREYNWFKKGIAFITRKELPYNKATLFAEEATLLKIYNTHTSVLAEPKKLYSKKELKQLLDLVAGVSNEEVSWVTGDNKDNSSLFTIINIIRPDTFTKEEAKKIPSIILNKYYKIISLKDESIWSEYIY